MSALVHRIFKLLWIVALTISIVAPRAAEKTDLEFKVKSVLLLKLISYVDWPTNTFESPTAPFRIAVLGADPFGGLLDEVLKGEQASGRPIEIIRAKNSSDCKRAQLVFISASEKDRFAAILVGLPDSALLTVSDIERFARKGGMIGMVRDDKNVRFEVNIDACKRAGLTIHSRLSSFARVVPQDK